MLDMAGTPTVVNNIVTRYSSCVMSSGKTQLMEGQKVQALISHHAFYVVSDQSLGYLSHMSICRKSFSLFAQFTIYEYLQTEKADLENISRITLFTPP